MATAPAHYLQTEPLLLEDKDLEFDNILLCPDDKKNGSIISDDSNSSNRVVTAH